MDEYPELLAEGLAKVRDSARTNMLDFKGVVGLLYLFGYVESADWLEGRKRDYMDILNTVFAKAE